MRRRGTHEHTILIAVIASAFVLVGDSITASFDGPRNLRAQLEGLQENPSLSTTGRGHLKLRINEEMETIEYELAYDDLEGVGTTPFVTNGVVLFAHIHISAPGVNGGVAVFLCGGGGKAACPSLAGSFSGVIVPADIVGPGGQGINPGETTAFEELVRSLRAGYGYANVHTTRWPGGEIRGQIGVGGRP